MLCELCRLCTQSNQGTWLLKLLISLILSNLPRDWGAKWVQNCYYLGICVLFSIAWVLFSLNHISIIKSQRFVISCLIGVVLWYITNILSLVFIFKSLWKQCIFWFLKPFTSLPEPKIWKPQSESWICTQQYLSLRSNNMWEIN